MRTFRQSGSIMALDGLVYCKGARSERALQLETRRSQAAPKSGSTKPRRRLNEGVMERQRQLEQAWTKDNFVECRTVALSKGDPGYGRPQEGTRTAERGKKAHRHVHKEILELCEVGYCFGPDGNMFRERQAHFR